MSQAGLLKVIDNILPPDVPLEFDVDLNDTTLLPGDIPVAAGVAVPAANVLRVSGDNGIKTVATPNADTSNFTIRFIKGNTTTSGAVTSNVITQPTLTDSVLTIQIIVAGFADNNAGIGAYGTAVVKNVGGVATLVNTDVLIINAEASLVTADVTVTTAGANLLINVLGVAGRNINWGACLPGIVVSD